MQYQYFFYIIFMIININSASKIDSISINSFRSKVYKKRYLTTGGEDINDNGIIYDDSNY